MVGAIDARVNMGYFARLTLGYCLCYAERLLRLDVETSQRSVSTTRGIGIGFVRSILIPLFLKTERTKQMGIRNERLSKGGQRDRVHHEPAIRDNESEIQAAPIEGEGTDHGDCFVHGRFRHLRAFLRALFRPLFR